MSKAVLRLGVASAGVLICLAAGPCQAAPAGQAASAAASSGDASGPSGRPILSERHFWRKHYAFFPPSLSAKSAAAAGLPTDAESRAKVFAKTHDAGLRTPPPPPEWTGPDFPDSEWLLRRGREFVTGDWRMISSALDETSVHLRGGDPFIEQVGLVSLRGKFLVRDRAKVGTLTLGLTYRGGFVAYLNGREIARAHLPEGKLEPTTPADDYPLAAWLATEDKGDQRKGHFLHAFDPKAPWHLRERTFGPKEVPTDALRVGANVLAIEFHRSDYPAEIAAVKADAGWQRGWSPVGLSLLKLEADGSDGAIAGAGPEPLTGLRVWTADITRGVSTLAAPNLDEGSAPVRIVAARNGAFSGQVIAAGDKPLAGLTATLSDLKHAGGKGSIPAGAGRVRYAVANPFWPAGILNNWGLTGLSYLDAVVPVDLKVTKEGGVGQRLDVLLDEPPQPAVNCVGVWATVRVPKDAPPGLYKGELTVEAQGAQPVRVPVELSVSDWTLPDAKDYAGLMNIYQSPDTLELYYKVPRWSEEHWQLIDKSLALLGKAGNIGLFLPLLAEAQMGNAESFVWWLPQDDGTYKYDFTVFDRYLDAAMKHHDKDRLRFICLDVWGYEGDGDKAPVLVTVLNPKTGRKDTLKLPRYGTPESAALLRPLLLACRERLKARGLDKKLLLGMAWDVNPKAQTAAMFREILPEAGWLRESHFDVQSFVYDAKTKASVPVLYNSIVWGGGIPNPAAKRLYGWNHGQRLVMNYNRVGVDCLVLTGFPPPWSYHIWMESTLACGRNGNGNCGGDFWRIVDQLSHEKRLPAGGSGAYWNGSGTLYGIYPASNVGRTAVGNNTADLLGPGPKGPVSTVRLENALENNQESEARVFIEKALLNKGKPLPAELAGRCQSLLDERTNVLRLWALGASALAPYQWQERNRRLFELAGEVAKAAAE